jgi:hypothetical protein
MTSFIAACGAGRSASVIPAVPAAWSVTTIAFMGIVPRSSSVSLVEMSQGWPVSLTDERSGHAQASSPGEVHVH